MKKNIPWILAFLFAVGWAITAYFFWRQQTDVNRRVAEGEQKIAALSAEGVTLRSQLSLASDRQNQLASQLTTATAENQQVASQLSTVQQELHDEQSKLPLAVKFRPAALGRGEVLVLRNESDKYLPLAIQVRNPTTGKAGIFQPQLQPYATFEIGHLEGWSFASGDQLTIESNGFTTFSGVAP